MLKQKLIQISNKKIGEGQPVFVVAEAGVNHNGRLDLALKLIDAAAETGADAVKFQTWKAGQLVTKSGKMADYQKRNIGKEQSQFDMLKKLELKEQWYPALLKRAKQKGVILLSTPHGGFEAVDLMEHYNFPAFKFASGDITNLPLLSYAAKRGKPMLISTGMSTLSEVKEAVKTVRKEGNNQILVFQCTTDYPLLPENVNLKVMINFKKQLGTIVGYSDHTPQELATLMAVTLGASMIEKHFTLDKKMPGPDHIASMEVKEFKEMVQKLRLIPVILGTGKKIPLSIERQYMTVARKSLVVSKKIKKGEKFTKKNLSIKRPGDGMLPKLFDKVLGKKSSQEIPEDTLLTKKMIRK